VIKDVFVFYRDWCWACWFWHFISISRNYSIFWSRVACHWQCKYLWL